MPDREEINTGTSKRYIRRDDNGRFNDQQVEVGRSLRKDRQVDAEHDTRKGQGDRGDRRGS
jgi:hypothetical protein